MKQKHGRGADAALEMLEAFSSVNVCFFDITHTNIEGEKRGFRAKQSLETAKTSMPHLVDSSSRRQNNVIIRPHHPRPNVLIQLDDLKGEALARVAPVSFLTIQTSPGNHQAWIAVQGREADADFARRLRKGAGADPTASGATRLAGTANFKPKYAPSFPVVSIEGLQPGRIASVDELKALGLVSPPESVRLAPEALKTQKARVGAGKWPSYQYCLSRAPKAHGADHPDVSRADFTWCMTAIDWGWTPEETARRLMEESGKARENGQQYAIATATNAAAAVMRRHQSAELAP